MEAILPLLLYNKNKSAGLDNLSKNFTCTSIGEGVLYSDVLDAQFAGWMTAPAKTPWIWAGMSLWLFPCKCFSCLGLTAPEPKVLLADIVKSSILVCKFWELKSECRCCCWRRIAVDSPNITFASSASPETRRHICFETYTCEIYERCLSVINKQKLRPPPTQLKNANAHTQVSMEEHLNYT